MPGWFWCEQPKTGANGLFWSDPREPRMAEVDPIVFQSQRQPGYPQQMNGQYNPQQMNAQFNPQQAGQPGLGQPGPGQAQTGQVPTCPVDHSRFGPTNPSNQMPQMPNSMAPGQNIRLPTTPTTSSIPRGQSAEEGNWVYPSPQQMMNALTRKSPEGVEVDAVESMVDVHNFLNEGVWKEVQKWEAPHTSPEHPSRLLRFQGRPRELSPRARLLQWRGWLMPKSYGCPAPFDRHDWTILRPTADGDTKTVRYVIDFYEAPDEGGMPAFSVDVRPALDSVEAAVDRFKSWWGANSPEGVDTGKQNSA